MACWTASDQYQENQKEDYAHPTLGRQFNLRILENKIKNMHNRYKAKGRFQAVLPQPIDLGVRKVPGTFRMVSY